MCILLGSENFRAPSSLAFIETPPGFIYTDVGVMESGPFDSGNELDTWRRLFEPILICRETTWIHLPKTPIQNKFGSLNIARKYVWKSLQWRHNGYNGVSNHQPHDCLLDRLFRRRSKKISKLRVTGLCEGNSPVTGEFPSQRASNAENVSIWWRHHVLIMFVKAQWNYPSKAGFFTRAPEGIFNQLHCGIEPSLASTELISIWKTGCTSRLTLNKIDEKRKRWTRFGRCWSK